MRLISFLRKGEGHVHYMADGMTVLVERADSQKIKLPAKTIRDTLAAGLIVQAHRVKPNDPFIVSVSHEGRKTMAGKQHMYATDPPCAARRKNDPVGAQSPRSDGSPLSRLYFAKKGSAVWLSKEEYHAGERLRADFEKSHLVGSLGVNWDAMGMPRFQTGAACSTETQDYAEVARKRLSIALADVGPELAGLLLDVCCFMKGLECVEAERRWPRRSAKLLLKVALAALDRHYNPPPCQKNRGRSVWHSKSAV